MPINSRSVFKRPPSAVVQITCQSRAYRWAVCILSPHPYVMSEGNRNEIVCHPDVNCHLPSGEEPQGGHVTQTLPRYGQIDLGERILLFSRSYIESTCVLVNAETPMLLVSERT